MQLYSTTLNNDGTYSFVYTDIATDISGVQFTFFSETHTFSAADLQNNITNLSNIILGYQNALAQAQGEQTASLQASVVGKPVVI